MEKRGKRCPIEVCEKLYRAVTTSPASQTIRRISSNLHPRFSKTTDIHSSPNSSKPKTNGNRQTEVVKITYDYSSPSPPNEKPKSSASPVELIQKDSQIAKVTVKPEAAAANAIHGQGAKPNPEPAVKPSHAKLDHGGKSGVHIEDRFTEFIKKVKNTTAHPGEGKHTSGKGNSSDHAPGKDHFSDYIDRTKHKIRTTLSIGHGRSNSFK